MRPTTTKNKTNTSTKYRNQSQETKNIQFTFFDYSISLSSFLLLHQEPIKGNIKENGDLKDNPLFIVSVFGNAKTGKTRLIAELERQFTIAKSYQKPPSDPNVMYFKSVMNGYNSMTNLLFIKAPSLSHPLPKIPNVLYNQLLLDRKLMKKFVLGFLATYSHIMIIVVGLESDKDYRKYYHEINQVRRADDKIIIIHNLSALREKKKESFKKLTNNIQVNSKKPSTKYSPKKNRVSLNKRHVNNKNKVLIISNKNENMINSFIQDDDTKIKALINELEKNEKYEKMHYKQLNDSVDYDLDHYYAEKDNPSIIHLLYDPLPLDDTTHNNPTNYTQNNTQMIRFLAGTIAVYPKRKTEEGILDSFKKYLMFYIQQIYESKPDVNCINNEYRLCKENRLKQITDDLTTIDMTQKFPLQYSYNIIQNELVIYLEKANKSQMKMKGKIIGCMNVLTISLCYKNENIHSRHVYSNTPSGETSFEIKIPTAACVISNFKGEIKVCNGIITIRFKII